MKNLYPLYQFTWVSLPKFRQKVIDTSPECNIGNLIFFNRLDLLNYSYCLLGDYCIGCGEWCDSYSRYMVANRDWEPFDNAPPICHRFEAWFCYLTLFWGWTSYIKRQGQYFLSTSTSHFRLSLYKLCSALHKSMYQIESYRNLFFRKLWWPSTSNCNSCTKQLVVPFKCKKLRFSSSFFSRLPPSSSASFLSKRSYHISIICRVEPNVRSVLPITACFFVLLFGSSYFGQKASAESIKCCVQGEEVEGPGEGYLVIKRSWPSGMRTLSGDHDRFQNVYFSNFKGYYMTGDGARRDADGYYWLIGTIFCLILNPLMCPRLVWCLPATYQLFRASMTSWSAKLHRQRFKDSWRMNRAQKSYASYNLDIGQRMKIMV